MAVEKNTNDAVMDEADDPSTDQTLMPPDGMEVQTQDVVTDKSVVDDEPQFEIPPRKDDTEELRNELEEQKRKAAEHLDLALRAQAELDNARKRAARDVENAHKYALEKFVNELLPVLDSMELGLSAAGTAPETATLREGMELTLKMLAGVMEKFGVAAIDPQGEKFNPEQHQAVSMLEQPDAPSGTVITVMQKGYELNGRLVRPAMVVVAK